MEFYPADSSLCADAVTLQKTFEGDILVVPAVSFANIGQLTVDLAINTLLHRGNASDATIEKIGHLFSTAVPPIAGAAAFGPQSGGPVSVNLEVFRVASRGITFIQQRTDVVKGKARIFAAQLTDWAKTSGFSTIVIIAGADDMLRHDHNMQRRPIRTLVSTPDATYPGLRNASFLSAVDATFSDDKAAWTDFRGVGVAPLIHQQGASFSPPLPVVSFVLSCAEGDNVPDAINTAMHLFNYLEIQPQPTPSAQPEPFFAIPPSWNQLFGRGPDASLFL